MGMRKAFPHMLACDLNEHLHEKFPDNRPDLVVHCWGDVLGHSEDLHCGTHTENIRGCTNSKLLRNYMALIQIKAAQLWEKGLITVRVWCICENGAHKSLALAKIMQDAYQHEGYNSKGPYPMKPELELCWNCESCKPNHDTDICMCSLKSREIAFKLFQNCSAAEMDLVEAGEA